MPKPLATWNPARDVWEKPWTESLFCGHLDVYSETFPPSGTMRNGELSASATSVVPTSVPVSSSSPTTAIPTPSANDGSRGGARPHQDNQLTNNSRDLAERITSGHTPEPAQEINLFLPTPNTMDSLDWREGEARHRAVNRGRDTGGGKRTGNLREEVHFDFREYTPAIKKWEGIMGRQAPPAATPSKTGRPQLNPRFSEWLMGLPDGWVTDPQIGITRAEQLKAIGNGVCPQQAATALTEMWANLQPNTQKGA